MAQHQNSPQQGGQQAQEPAHSGGQRSTAGSNYGDWRPEPQPATQGADADTDAAKSGPPDAGPPSTASPVSSPGTGTPSTAPSGIGSTPHK